MQTKELSSWDDFEIELLQLEQYRDELTTGFQYPDILVFRGQSNSGWHLETMLERHTKKESFSMYRYLEIIKRARSRLPAITSSWETLDKPEYVNWYDHRNSLWRNGLGDYMVYLRHHGFPSPLLDWSISPDIAAYFAFRDVNSSTESVAIFAFLETTTGTKGDWLAQPNISRIRSNPHSETRHARQQSTYTYCSTELKEGIYYCFHEKVFTGNRRHKFPQDVLWKFILPSSEREKVMKRLESKHITTATLFASEDFVEESKYLQDLFSELDRQEI
jgi:hypothetical protein